MYDMNNINITINENNDDINIIFAVEALSADCRSFSIVWERAGFGVGRDVVHGCEKREVDDLLFSVHMAAAKAGCLELAGDIECLIGRYGI